MGVKSVPYDVNPDGTFADGLGVYECDGFGFSIVHALTDDERRYNSILFQYGQWPRSVWPERIEEEASALEQVLCLPLWKS